MKSRIINNKDIQLVTIANYYNLFKSNKIIKQRKKSLFKLKINIHLFILFLYLLFPILSLQDNLSKNKYKEPYLSVIFIGKGNLEIVGKNRKIIPDHVYYTSTFEEIDVIKENDWNIDYKFYINIKNNGKFNENNITMEFSEGDYYMNNLFEGLENIKKVDLSHYSTAPSSLYNTFKDCQNLEEVIFGNFDTFNVSSMESMFEGTKVKYLDLSRFNTTKIRNMKKMFFNCHHLAYLNIENFNFQSLNSLDKMLSKCDSLKYINIKSIKNEDSLLDYLVNKLNQNFLYYCINEERAVTFEEKLSKKGYILNCSYSYENINIPVIESANVIESTNEINLESTIIIKDECSPEDLFQNKCGNKSQNNDENLSIEEQDRMINNIIDDITNGNLDTLLEKIINGEEEDYIVQQKDVSYQLTTTQNQIANEYKNISTINLGKCEEVLKSAYHIDNSSSLIILKLDYFMADFKIPVIGYEVFHPDTKIKLNLSLCSDLTVDYNIPVDIKEEDLDKYNTSSDYYNDECSAYTTNDGTDIIIRDRKKEFNENNMFLCENNCNYTNYNSTTKKSVCMCGVKSKIYSISEILDNKESISQSFNISDSSSSSSNLNLMKCVDTLFSKYGVLKNLEFYILIIMIILYAISAIIYYRIGNNLIENDIQEILDEKYKSNKNIKRNKRSKTKVSKIININPNIEPKPKELVSNPKKRHKTIKLKESNTSVIKNNINVDVHKSISELKINNLVEIPKESIAPQMNLTDYELNSLSYNEALVFDKRDLMKYYFSLIKTKHPIIFSFVPIQDYNSKTIKIDLFILNFAICSAINALFFNETTIHKIYVDQGLYDLGFFLPKIIISFLITHIFSIGLKYLFLSQKAVVEIKKKPTYEAACDEADQAKRCLMIKYIIFFILGNAFLLIFWFYLSSFCAVYQNTQIFLIINTFISMMISFLYPMIINFFPAFLRNYSLKSGHNICMYKASQIIQLI